MRCLLLVDAVHGPGGAVGEEQLDRARRPLLGVRERGRLLRARSAQYPIGRHRPHRGTTDADPDPEEAGIAERGHDGIDAAVTAGATAAAHAEPADLEIDV